MGRAMAGAGILGKRSRAEKGVIPVVSGEGATKGAALTEADDGPADVTGVPVVPAAHFLGEVAPKGGHVSHVGARYGICRLREELILLSHGRRFCNVGKLRKGAYLQPFAVSLDVVETVDGLQVYDRLGIVDGDPVFHGPEEVRASRVDLCLSVIFCEESCRLPDRSRAVVCERFHSSSCLPVPSALCRA